MAVIDVSPESDLPNGKVTQVWVDDEPIGVYHVDGRYFALGDVCTHQEFYLSDGGLIEDHTVECALHGSKFDLRTGEALCMPATGEVPTYRVWVEDGIIKLEVPD